MLEIFSLLELLNYDELHIRVWLVFHCDADTEEKNQYFLDLWREYKLIDCVRFMCLKIITMMVWSIVTVFIGQLDPVVWNSYEGNTLSVCKLML